MGGEKQERVRWNLKERTSNCILCRRLINIQRRKRPERKRGGANEKNRNLRLLLAKRGNPISAITGNCSQILRPYGSPRKKASPAKTASRRQRIELNAQQRVNKKEKAARVPSPIKKGRK